MKYGYGNFGNIAKIYDKGRQDFPKKVIEYCLSYVHKSNSDILDVGCGTGIATRQIYQSKRPLWKISGSDIDEKMIESARTHRDKISYFVCPTEKLLFADKRFDMVAAFSAFHWFANDSALNEIKRVLKNSGTFIAVNKNETGEFKKDIVSIIEKYTIKEIPNIKANYCPEAVLAENGFDKVTVKEFDTSEFFTITKALEQYRSMSLSNLVPVKFQQDALNDVKRVFESKLNSDHLLQRKLSVKVVTGVRP